jgi:hypothetical protein
VSDRLAVLAALAALYLVARSRGRSPLANDPRVKLAQAECASRKGLDRVELSNTPGGVNTAHCRDGTVITYLM